MYVCILFPVWRIDCSLAIYTVITLEWRSVEWLLLMNFLFFSLRVQSRGWTAWWKFTEAARRFFQSAHDTGEQISRSDFS